MKIRPLHLKPPAPVCCQTIHEVDYEDELDVMMVCHTTHQPNALQGVVGLYDNASGRHLISVKLDEPWPDVSSSWT